MYIVLETLRGSAMYNVYAERGAGFWWERGSYGRAYNHDVSVH